MKNMKNMKNDIVMIVSCYQSNFKGLKCPELPRVQGRVYWVLFSNVHTKNIFIHTK